MIETTWLNKSGTRSQAHVLQHVLQHVLEHVVDHTQSTTYSQPHTVNHVQSTTHIQPHAFKHIQSTTRIQAPAFKHIHSTTRIQAPAVEHTVKRKVIHSHCMRLLSLNMPNTKHRNMYEYTYEFTASALLGMMTSCNLLHTLFNAHVVKHAFEHTVNRTQSYNWSYTVKYMQSSTCSQVHSQPRSQPCTYNHTTHAIHATLRAVNYVRTVDDSLETPYSYSCTSVTRCGTTQILQTLVMLYLQV